ncbi:hypothetical protein EW146_g383 [Bondarzewia mesenterica]|uniref:Phosducin domain-containing protein n=1 Tax=Bondarzewia mesenterica TaxID=1095465 RepID=A0A4S4M8Q4_9AGAM|nr:hypothetical protein EW146_g383 [Bondarzewia mesenterica]
MAINPNEDTEFNEALRKHGILPPREPTPPSPSPPPSPTLDDLLEDLTPSQLQEFGENAHDDEAERYVFARRQRLLAEMKRDEERARFGQVFPIGRDDYTREVTDASKVDELGDEENKGTGVVCFLYKDGIPRSDIAYRHVQTLAARHPRTKFVSIVGDKCLPNLPDSRVPMFIIYRGGEIRTQVVAWGADRERRIEGQTLCLVCHVSVMLISPLFSLTELEALLIASGAVVIPERRTAPKHDDSDEDEEDEEDDDLSSGMQSTTTYSKKIRGAAKKEDDSDSDFDL